MFHGGGSGLHADARPHHPRSPSALCACMRMRYHLLLVFAVMVFPARCGGEGESRSGLDIDGLVERSPADDDPKVDGDCRLCIISFGGCGTTAFNKHLLPHRNQTTTEYDECTRSHSHWDPFSIVLPEDVTIIYLFCDPINAFLSLARRHASSILFGFNENNPNGRFVEFHCVNLRCSPYNLAHWRSLETNAVEEATRRYKIEKKTHELEFCRLFIDAMVANMTTDPFRFHEHMQAWLEASRDGTLSPRPVIFADVRSLSDQRVRNSLAVMAQCPAISTFETRERVSNHSNFGAISRFRMERVYKEASALINSLPSISYFH